MATTLSHRLTSQISNGVGTSHQQRRSNAAPSEGGAHADREEGTMATSSGKRGRSAVTSRFVKQATVKKNPKTTVNETTTKSTSKKSK